MLTLQSVSKRFGGLEVLQDVSLEVPPGGIFGLIGPNGAGKTTVFNIITGLYAPTRGQVTFEGRDLAGLKPHAITRLGIARTFQNIRVFKEMSLVQNVTVGMHRHLHYGPIALLLSTPRFREAERAAQERALELLSWVKLDHRAHEVADELSYGDQRKLELARALATGPKLLMLDEPVAGMNTVEKTELMRVIEGVRGRGYTIFLIEHDMRFVMGLCEHIAVLNFGRIISAGGPDHVRQDPQVIEAYLGRDDEDDAAAGRAPPAAEALPSAGAPA